MSTAGASGDACSTRIIALLSAAAAGSAATRRMATRPVPTAILDTRVLIEAFLLCTVFVQPCRRTVQGGGVICQVFVHTQMATFVARGSRADNRPGHVRRTGDWLALRREPGQLRVERD